jgi:hypothetical protein
LRVPVVGVASTAMTKNTSDAIIGQVFEAAAEDERTRPLLSHLRSAYETGHWTPEALASIVERATAEEMGTAS